MYVACLLHVAEAAEAETIEEKAAADGRAIMDAIPNLIC
jgi:hypothetical protein